MNKYLQIWEPVLRSFEENYDIKGVSNKRGMRATIVDWYPSGYSELTITMSDGMMYVYNLIGNSITPIRNKDGVEDSRDEISRDEGAWRKNFSKRLVIKMKKKGISQDRLSRLSGISTVTLSKYMNGLASPSGYNLERLSRALGCSVSELTSVY